MLDAINTVATHLLTAPTAAAAAAALGAIVPGPAPDGSSATFVRPSNHQLTQARIAALPDGSVHTATLTLASPITLAALRHHYGAYQVTGRSDPDVPWTLRFPNAAHSDLATLTLLVEATGPLDSLDTQPIAKITLRRDARE